MSVLNFPDMDGRYGACPHCSACECYTTVGSGYFLICKTHGVYWPAGENLPWPRPAFDILEEIQSLNLLASLQPTVPVYPLPVRAPKQDTKEAA